MNTESLFIPEKIKIGFQDRTDTYTKKLAYVTYFDKKGVLRKEKSWEGWRDKKINPVEFNNEPIEGFVLNKGVGGSRYSSGWNARSEYIRVYDPRDFEFEISVANLLFILRECDCSRGKGLEGKFVYAWDRTNLVLLPNNSPDYQESITRMELKTLNFKVKDLIVGASYITKQNKTYIYVGKYDYYYFGGNMKKYIFLDVEPNEFVILDDVKIIAKLNSDVIDPNIAEIIDRYYKSANGSKVVKLFLTDKPEKSDYNHNHIMANGNSYAMVYCYNDNDNPWHYTSNKDISGLYIHYYFVDGVVNSSYKQASFKFDSNYVRKYLVAQLESGSKYYVGYNSYSHEYKEDLNGI
jgi:hypothetical protein